MANQLPTDVNITSYDSFKTTTIGQGYNVDGNLGIHNDQDEHGFQCWDYGALLWGLTGDFSYPYLSTNGTGYAYGIWEARNQNAGDTFDLITDINQVKRGDMVVLDKGRYTGDISGHNAFADEDYNGSGELLLLGQNQENPSVTYGHVVTLDRLDVSTFLGAFRYKQWIQPTPVTRKKKKFPWYIYNNRRAML